MIVINLFGSPGAGKSTGAAYIFSQLKMKGVNAELVTEFAKDKTWEENWTALSNQIYIFGKQAYKIDRCADKVDVIVTDAPLLLSLYYNNDPRLKESFTDMVIGFFSSYNNLNYLVERDKPYNPAGRKQSEKEADGIYHKIKELLHTHKVDFTQVGGNIKGYDFIVKEALNAINKT